MTESLIPPSAAAPHVTVPAVIARALGAPQAARRTSTRGWTKRYRRYLTLTDVVIVFAVSASAVQISGPTPSRIAFAGLLATIWSLALEFTRSRSTRVVGIGPSEYKRVAVSTMFTLGTIGTTALAFDVAGVRALLVYAVPVGGLALILCRWLWRQWLTAQRRDGNYLTRALVIGPEEEVREVARRLDERSGAYRIVGAVIDGHEGTVIPLGWRDIPVVAQRDSIAEAVEQLGADTVIVAGQYSGDKGFVRHLGWALEESSTDLVLASGLTDIAGPRIHVRPVEGLPLMHVELPTFEGGKHVIKRTFDIALAAIALLALAPVFAVIALLVKRDSLGPILFRQERVGKDGRTFEMIKFRSMRATAEDELAALRARNEGAGVLFKLKDDPRVTRIGKILRKHSLDELPQIWNILVGDMSIVGPRPPLQREVSEYEQHVTRRLYIKPGLTGLWQISGRSDLSWEESVRLDLYYVENWSLLGDLVIMWRTVKVLLGRSGAY